MRSNKQRSVPRIRAVSLKLPALLLCLLLLFTGALTAYAENVNEVYTVAQVESLCDGIVAYNGAYSRQDFIDGYLCDNAGTTAEFYAIALSQSGNDDFSRYESALLRYLDTHEVYSATSREKFALALSAAGSTDRYITDTADEAIGGLGIMSLVFGLHILNNGYPSALYSADGLVSEILSWQKDDGGWAVMGSYGDVDVTAMTLQALAPHYGRGGVSAAIDRAVDFLSSRQLDDGGFKTMGAENCESAAQVVIALSALGIDAQYDGRFIKNGCSAMNGMMRYYLGGGFSHDDSGANASATMEAFCALTAYRRYCYGQSPLYVLDHAQPVAVERNDESPQNDPVSRDNDTDRDQNGSNAHNSTDTKKNDNTANNGDRVTDQRTNGNGSSAAAADRSNKNSGSSAVDGDSSAVTDADGNRIVTINGKKYVEATTASGEKMTVAVSESEESQGQESAPGAKPAYGGFQPTGSAEMTVQRAATADEAKGSGSYKIYAVLGVLLAGGAACAVLFVLKKRGKKHFIAVGVITAAGILFILLTNFQSTQEHQQTAVVDGDRTVTLTIRCDTITDHAKENDFIPGNGVILDTTEYSVSEGDTVFDVLSAAVSEHSIPMDNRGAKGAAYIAGINTLYEFDYGDLSGWMYRVNGEFPDVGCESCLLSDGDRIEWLYTTNIGKDLE